MSNPTHSFEISECERIVVGPVRGSLTSNFLLSRLQFVLIKLGKSAKMENVSVLSSPYMHMKNICPQKVFKMTSMPDIKFEFPIFEVRPTKAARQSICESVV